jgi:prepilin-type N-terminal cleavage/methylation domain-containing protein
MRTTRPFDVAQGRLRARGYTAVEVMMGITLFAIGAAAVISMQRAAMQGNVDARKLDMANQIAREWLERLRRDAALWTLPSSANPTANTNYTNAKLLSGHLAYGAPANVTAWSFPDDLVASATKPDGLSPAFDILGRDLLPADFDKAVFCTHIRLNWLDQPVSGGATQAPQAIQQLIRAEVRVLWARALVNSPAAGWCSNGTSPNSLTALTDTYHFVYATTAVRQNPAQ